MNLQKIKELINQARASNSKESCHKLADRFEEFIELYSQKDLMGGSMDYLERLDKSQLKFWEAFTKATEDFGFTPDTLAEHFENPANFSPSYWANLQTLKSETADKTEKTPLRALKNHNKKVRI